jgi:hypothetical protein
MTSLEDISQKVNNFIFTNHISEDGIICDEGDNNQTMINGANRRWSYSSTNEIGQRSEIEDIQLHILNDAMDIITNLQMYFMHYTNDGPIETVDPHTSQCLSFNCHPGCSCGAWDANEPYVQEENYMDMGCATEADKQRLLESQQELRIIDRSDWQTQVQTRSQALAQAQAQAVALAQEQAKARAVALAQEQVQANSQVQQNPVDQMMGEMDEMSIG